MKLLAEATGDELQAMVDKARDKAAVGCRELLAVLGATAESKELTAQKAAHVAKRDLGQITGFVVTLPGGDVAIVDKSAVRWLTKYELWWLMHESESPLMTANAPGERPGQEARELKP